MNALIRIRRHDCARFPFIRAGRPRLGESVSRPLPSARPDCVVRIAMRASVSAIVSLAIVGIAQGQGWLYAVPGNGTDIQLQKLDPATGQVISSTVIEGLL